MSKPRESFRIGKVTIAKLAIRGKTLKLYLALDPSKYIDGRYKIKNILYLRISILHSVA